MMMARVPMGTIMIPPNFCPSWLPSWLCLQQEQEILAEDLPPIFSPPPVPPLNQEGGVYIPPVGPQQTAGEVSKIINYVTGSVPPEECGILCWLNNNRLSLLAVAGVVGVFVFMPQKGRRR